MIQSQFGPSEGLYGVIELKKPEHEDSNSTPTPPRITSALVADYDGSHSGAPLRGCTGITG